MPASWTSIALSSVSIVRIIGLFGVDDPGFIRSVEMGLIAWRAYEGIRMNWKKCAAVETVPGRVSGEPVIRGSRVRPDDLVINRAEGEAWLAENFDLPIETVQEVLRFYDRHKPTL